MEQYPQVGVTIFDSSWGTLNESGEEIGLKDNSGTLVEVFTYVPAKDFSLERLHVEQFDYSEQNWAEHPDGNSVGVSNYWTTGVEIEEEQEESESVDSTEDEMSVEEVFDEQEEQDESGFFEPEPENVLPVPHIMPVSSTAMLGSPIFFDASSSTDSDGEIVSYLWDFGDGTEGNGELVEHVYSTTGTFSAVLTVTDSDVASVSTSIVVHIADVEAQDQDVEAFEEDVGSTAPLKEVWVDPSPDVAAGAVVINEFVSDPVDDAVEFVELFNTTEFEISLKDWKLEDGSETKTTFRAGTIAPHGFFVVEKPKGNLNNKGDRVVLLSPDEYEIDKVVYGAWDDMSLDDNAPVAADPNSIARVKDGRDSNHDRYDFKITTTITKGAPNVITELTPKGDEVSAVLVSDIIITEVFPNPAGSDAEDEFIELYNKGEKTIDMTGWKVADASRSYTLPEVLIPPNTYLVFKRLQTNIALNNSGGETVVLRDAAGRVVDEVRYTGKAHEGLSFAKGEKHAWEWTTKVTGGAKNAIEIPNSPPLVSLQVDTDAIVGQSVVFDASDTSDPDADELLFVWDFGDGKVDGQDVMEYVFSVSGTYKVLLEVYDAHEAKTQKQVYVDVSVPQNQETSVTSTAVNFESIYISTIFPNPAGSDDAEYIELFNSSTAPVHLGGLQIDDVDGGSRPYTIPGDVTVAAWSFMRFPKKDSKITLNNTTDAVRLLHNGAVIQEVVYEDVVEDGVYLQNHAGVWVWRLPEQQENDSKRGATNKSTKKKTKKDVVTQTILEKARSFDKGDRIRVQGIVSAKPGVLGSQYFYIAGVDASSTVNTGMQVYMHKKQFPELQVGDMVEVQGEISESRGEMRLKARTSDDIQKKEYAGLLQTSKLEVVDIGVPYEGQLISTSGEITDIKQSYMYLDDGTEEVKTYFKRGTGIHTKDLKVGDLVEVTGIVGKAKDGYQLLPRSMQDITKTGASQDAIVFAPQPEGASSKEVAEKYLTATAGGLSSILIGLFAKSHGGRGVKLVRGVVRVLLRRKTL